MISYETFKKLFDNINPTDEVELEINFNNKQNKYMIIKYAGYITFQRCGTQEEQSGEMKYNSLDELYNNKTIDNISLKDEWSNIEDIIFNYTYSLVEDKDELFEMYKIKI